MAKRALAPFAVRVTILDDETGCSYVRTYVRETRLGRQAYAAFAIGDLILTVDEDIHGHKITVTSEEIDVSEID